MDEPSRQQRGYRMSLPFKTMAFGRNWTLPQRIFVPGRIQNRPANPHIRTVARRKSHPIIAHLALEPRRPVVLSNISEPMPRLTAERGSWERTCQHLDLVDWIARFEGIKPRVGCGTIFDVEDHKDRCRDRALALMEQHGLFERAH